MPNATSGLDQRLREGLERVGSADILVGIPSYNNAGTIGHVARSAAKGLRERFPGRSVVIVNSDGGSKDGTPDVVRAATEDVPTITGAYVGPPGKGSAFRAIFEIATALEAKACAVVDSDLRSITPEWIARLIGPIEGGVAEYVTPLYARHKHDGTITNSIAYPLTRALYGKRVRQPIGGEFGFSGDLAKRFLDQPVWDTDVARFGIDIYMTTTALVDERKIAQAFLGAKIHDPKDPGADLAPMFIQVVGTAFAMAAREQESWRSVTGSRQVPVSGDTTPVEPEPVGANVALLEEKLEASAAEHGPRWRAILGERPRDFGPRAWARIVYAFLAASAAPGADRDRIVRSLVPLYFGRVAKFVRDAEPLTSAESERLVEEQAEAFEAEKAWLVDRLT